MAPSSGWAATTSAWPSFPTPRSSISTAASSRPPSSTATCTSPRPGSRSPASICARPRRRGTACSSSPNTRGPHPDGPIWGHGWDESGWPETTPPSTDELDAVVGDRPAYLARVDVHSAVASTALRRLTPGLPAAQGFDPQRPLTADAHHLVRAAARDRLTPDQRARARVAALDLAAANGIVAVHECAGPDIGGLDDWQELRDTRHGVEIVGYWGEAVTDRGQAEALIETTGARGLAGDLFVDGALGSRTAWLHEPYADAPDRCGNTYLDRRRHHGASARLHRSGHPGRLPRDRRRGGQRGRRRLAAGGRPARHAGGRALRAPARAPRNGDPRAGRPARRVGRHRKRATELRRAVGRRAAGCMRSVSARTEPCGSTRSRC